MRLLVGVLFFGSLAVPIVAAPEDSMPPSTEQAPTLFTSPEIAVENSQSAAEPAHQVDQMLPKEEIPQEGTQESNASTQAMPTAPANAPEQPPSQPSANQATVTQPAQEGQAPKAAEQPSGAQQVEPEAAATEEKLEGIGIDTIDLEEPSGNWLHKRIWWERSQQRFDRLKQKVGEVLEARLPFMTKKTEAEQTIFDPLYLEVGVGQGELTVILSYLVQEIEQLRQKEGTLTKEERDFLDMVSSQQVILDQLGKDVQSMAKIDAALEDALNKLMEQGNLCRNYEKKAWEYLQIIVKELSDAKARELYYHIETLDKNAGDVLKYIKGEFTTSFDQLIVTAKEQAARIKATVQSLKEKGIDFKKQADVMEKQAAHREQERIAHEKEEAIQKAIEETEQDLSWSAVPGRIWRKLCRATESVGDYGISAWHYVAEKTSAAYCWVKELFGGRSTESEMADKAISGEENAQPLQAVPAPDVVPQPPVLDVK